MNNRENKVIIFILLVVCAMTLALCFIYTWHQKTHYSTIAIVDEINENEVLIVDPCGDIWAVDGIDNAVVGDYVEVTFYNNNTDYTHYDDEVTHVEVLDLER